MGKVPYFEAIKKMLSTENMSKVVKITNIVIFMSCASNSFREGALSYFGLAVLIFWFVFNIAFFAVRKRYITSLVFLSLLSVYLYAVFNFSVFII